MLSASEGIRNKGFATIAENSAVKIGKKKVEYKTKPLKRERPVRERRATFGQS